MIAFFKRYANARLRRQVDELTAESEAARREIKVLEAERDNLALCLARDRSRIEAEIAAYQRRKAEAEGRDDGRNSESVFDG